MTLNTQQDDEGTGNTWGTQRRQIRHEEAKLNTRGTQDFHNKTGNESKTDTGVKKRQMRGSEGNVDKHDRQGNMQRNMRSETRHKDSQTAINTEGKDTGS